MALFAGAGRGVAARRRRHARADRRAQRRGCRPGRCAVVAVVSGRRRARASTRTSAPSSSTAARPSTPRSTTCSRRSTRSRAEEVLVLPEQPQRGDGRRARGRALRQGGPRRRRAPRQQAGLAALVELDPAPPARRTPSASTSALAGIRIGVGRAGGPRRRRGPVRRRGDAVGFVGDEIVAWGGAGSTLAETIARLAEGAEIVTVIGGRGRADRARTSSRATRPRASSSKLHRRRPAPLLVAAGGRVAPATSPPSRARP